VKTSGRSLDERNRCEVGDLEHLFRLVGAVQSYVKPLTQPGKADPGEQAEEEADGGIEHRPRTDRHG